MDGNVRKKHKDVLAVEVTRQMDEPGNLSPHEEHETGLSLTITLRNQRMG
jgi:hypothetical protein